jgi:hypothetical protein
LREAQFLAQLRENREYKESVAVRAWHIGSLMEPDEDAPDVMEPGPEFTHFYRAEVV